MAKLTDPGLGKSAEEAKAARLKEFKRPSTAKERKAKRAERIAEALKGVSA